MMDILEFSHNGSICCLRLRHVALSYLWNAGGWLRWRTCLLPSFRVRRRSGWRSALPEPLASRGPEGAACGVLWGSGETLFSGFGRGGFVALRLCLQGIFLPEERGGRPPGAGIACAGGVRWLPDGSLLFRRRSAVPAAVVRPARTRSMAASVTGGPFLFRGTPSAWLHLEPEGSISGGR